MGRIGEGRGVKRRQGVGERVQELEQKGVMIQAEQDSGLEGEEEAGLLDKPLGVEWKAGLRLLCSVEFLLRAPWKCLPWEGARAAFLWLFHVGAGDLQ